MTPNVTQHEVAEAYASWLEMKDGLLSPSRDVDWPAIRCEIEAIFGNKGLRRIERTARRLAFEKIREEVHA